MKFEIDLNDIMSDEYGSTETLQESVRRQVVDALCRAAKVGVEVTIKTEVAKTVQATLAAELTSKMPDIISDILSSEYTPVSRYGENGKPTTFRAELVKGINEQMVYKRASYESDKNAFTKAVDTLVSEELSAFKKEFHSKVSAQFVSEAMAFATSELKKRLGVP